MKTIKDIDIKNKKVIIRCDLNVPIKDGKILDNTRIKSSLETINYCLENNAKKAYFLLKNCSTISSFAQNMIQLKLPVSGCFCRYSGMPVKMGLKREDLL